MDTAHTWVVVGMASEPVVKDYTVAVDSQIAFVALVEDIQVVVVDHTEDKAADMAAADSHIHTQSLFLD